MVELAEEEIAAAASKPELIEQDLKSMLLPKDTADDGSAFLEIRAGAGGDEAAIFALIFIECILVYQKEKVGLLKKLIIRWQSRGGLKKDAKLEEKVFKVLKI